MRNRLFVVVAALLLVAGGARAQDQASGDTPQQDTPKPAAPAAAASEFTGANQIDFGIRGTVFGSGSDQARFQRYRDLRDGGTVDVLRFTKETDAFALKFQGDHIGYRDQRFYGAYNNYGRVKASFEWNQVPLFYNQDTRSLYSQSSQGVFTLPTSVNQALQDKTMTLDQAVQGASLFTLDSRRDIASANLVFSASKAVDFTVGFRNTNKNGAQQYAVSYGISNAVASEFAAPVDQRTTEFNAALQWANDKGMAKIAYDGSFFRNSALSLTVDNPLRVTDSATAGPAAGRLAGAPDTDWQTGSVAGSYKLPGHSQASGYVSLGTARNNTTLLPFTSNSLLPVIPLDRPTADLTARVTSMNFSFTSAPTSYLWLSARYRDYSYDNRSPEFFVGNSINYDTSVTALNEATELLGYTRRTFDGDVSVTPWKYVAFRGGYTRYTIDYANPSTNESGRYIDKNNEDTLRGSVDLTHVGWLTLRGIYEHSQRRGAGFDVEKLLDIGEQPTMRQFDIADRDKDSFRGLLQIMPVSQVSINASAGVGRENYPGTNFGLRNNDNNVYSIGFDYVPQDKVSMGLTYGYEKYTALQASRTANPLPAGGSLDDPTQQFNDPKRNWTDDSADKVHTWSASLDLLKVFPKTELRMSYDYSQGKSTYVYGLTPDTVIAAPVQLPAVTNLLQWATVDARYFITPHLAAGVVYWFDKYDVTDFALNPTPSLASPQTGTSSLMLMGNFFRPYQANTFWGRITYFW